MIFAPDNPHRFETYVAGDGHPAIRVVGVTQDEWLAAQAEIERLLAEVERLRARHPEDRLGGSVTA